MDSEAITRHKIADRFFIAEEEKIKEVEVCYLAAAELKFDEEIEGSCRTKSGRNIVVLPYLLFTGLLMKHIEKKRSAQYAVGRDKK